MQNLKELQQIKILEQLGLWIGPWLQICIYMHNVGIKSFTKKLTRRNLLQGSKLALQQKIGAGAVGWANFSNSRCGTCTKQTWLCRELQSATSLLDVKSARIHGNQRKMNNELMRRLSHCFNLFMLRQNTARKPMASQELKNWLDTRLCTCSNTAWQLENHDLHGKVSIWLHGLENCRWDNCVVWRIAGKMTVWPVELQVRWLRCLENCSCYFKLHESEKTMPAAIPQLGYTPPQPVTTVSPGAAYLVDGQELLFGENSKVEGCTHFKEGKITCC